MTEQHQHRFRPSALAFGDPFRGQPQVLEDFQCRCGRFCHIWPGLLAVEWRWSYLTDTGIRREWKRRARKLGLMA